MKRTALKKDSPYYVPKYRQLELKYFVLQYYEKKQQLSNFRLRKGVDPTGEEATFMASIESDIRLIEALATELDKDGFLLIGVTRDLSYDSLTMQRGVLPYSRKVYYNLYRRFFKKLDSHRKQSF